MRAFIILAGLMSVALADSSIQNIHTTGTTSKLVKPETTLPSAVDEHADHDHADHDHADHGHDDHADHDHDEHHHHDHDTHVDHDHEKRANKQDHAHYDEHVGHDHDHDHSHHDRHSEEIHGHGVHGQPKKNRLKDEKIWGAAIGSIFLIGACGIFGVMVVPIMNRKFYQHAVQFLISLAVGTLAGDALLHLLPHAIMGGHKHDHHGGEMNKAEQEMHQRSVWIGFVAAVSIIGFFLFEKIVNILGEWRNSRAQSHEVETKRDNLRVVREGHVASDKAVGENICKHKYSNYCVQDFENQHDKNVGESLLNGTPKNKNLSNIDSEANECEKKLLPAVSDSVLNNKNSNYKIGSNGFRPDHDTVIISHHETVHHGHSHAHSHIHSAPDTISSVAWMVIFGDGIHNLADGLAIGAAFADGMWSGISTSVAVLCHELPHEIGDFAMLLKTGMSFKKAVFYNVVSSVLAFIGMVIGLVLGNIEDFSGWMFAATAGVFLYVALVDMMPELTSGHTHPLSKENQKESMMANILCQISGMSLGVGIMAIIALYEEDFKTLLMDV